MNLYLFYLPGKKCFCFSSCRCIKPQLKSLALGFHALATRTLGKGLVWSRAGMWILLISSADSVMFQYWGKSFLCCLFLDAAGIPAPIYFGAIIDTTCLKWGQKRCGGLGACRIYNTTAYRWRWHSHPLWAYCGCLFEFFFFTNMNLPLWSSTVRVAYLGLTLSLRTISFIICIPGFVLLSHQLKKEQRNGIHGALANGGAELEVLRKEDLVISNMSQSQQTSDNSTDRETQLWQHPHAPRYGDAHTNKSCRESHTIKHWSSSRR